ncbi:MAG: hypothetical protein ACYC0B_05215 [Gemmatimonadaceae bacterium]
MTQSDRRLFADQPFTIDEFRAALEIELSKEEAREMANQAASASREPIVFSPAEIAAGAPAQSTPVFVADVGLYALLAEMSTDLAVRVERWISERRIGPRPELSAGWEAAFWRERLRARAILAARGVDPS